MKLFVKKDQPPEWENFVASDRWLQNFKFRFLISLRAATNAKSKSAEERLPEVRKFHNTAKQFRQPPPNNDPKYGRFPALQTYHMDQASSLTDIPCFFKSQVTFFVSLVTKKGMV